MTYTELAELCEATIAKAKADNGKSHTSMITALKQSAPPRQLWPLTAKLEVISRNPQYDLGVMIVAGLYAGELRKHMAEQS